jgi:nucleotide-binding universal stress UspA family protein
MTILVPFDFSNCSRVALRLATAIATRTGERLVLFHAMAPSPLDAFAASVAPGCNEEAQEAAAAALDAEAASLRDRGVATDVRVRSGSAADAILDAAREVGADLIAIGSHGRSGPAHLFLGSCADAVVRAARCAVLVTRADTAALDRWTGSDPLRLTAVADGSRASESALFWLRISPLAAKSQVSVVRVFWPPHEARRYGIDEPWLGRDGHPDLLRLLERDLRRDLPAIADAPPIRFRVAERDHREGVVEEERQLMADVVAVGVPRRQNGNSTGFTIGSFLRAATVPVFCIPEGLRPEAWRIPEVRSVLIACDLSDASRSTVAAGYDLLFGGGCAELCYVHAPPVPPAEGQHPGDTLTAEERATLESRLRALIPAHATDHGIATRVSVLCGDGVAEAILQAAERMDVDVVVLGEHSGSRIRRALMGSVAETVARQASRPVLLARTPAP